MSSSADKCGVSKDKHEDRRKMEYIREAINSTKGRKGKSKPPIGGVYKDVEVEEANKQFLLLLELSACYVSMTSTRLLDELAKAVRSLVLLFKSNYVRLETRKGYVGSLS